LLAHDLLVRLELARDALPNERHAQLGGALRARRRRPRRQKSHGEAGALRPDERGAVFDVELLALGAVGVQQDFPVGQHAVDIEEQYLYARSDHRKAFVIFVVQNISVRQRSCRCTTPLTRLLPSTTTIDVILRDSMMLS